MQGRVHGDDALGDARSSHLRQKAQGLFGESLAGPDGGVEGDFVKLHADPPHLPQTCQGSLPARGALAGRHADAEAEGVRLQQRESGALEQVGATLPLAGGGAHAQHLTQTYATCNLEPPSALGPQGSGENT